MTVAKEVGDIDLFATLVIMKTSKDKHHKT
jgi:hypothetical protein